MDQDGYDDWDFGVVFVGTGDFFEPDSVIPRILFHFLNLNLIHPIHLGPKTEYPPMVFPSLIALVTGLCFLRCLLWEFERSGASKEVLLE